jgi:hypothetical protein
LGYPSGLCHVIAITPSIGFATSVNVGSTPSSERGSHGRHWRALDRIADAIAVYDDLISRFGTATELPLRELVARAHTAVRVVSLCIPSQEEALAAWSERLRHNP